MKKVIVIGGATGVGKTELSLDIALKFNGEIINADASQFRKYLNIGTAKISVDEMRGVKHHLIDIINPNDDFSISEYQTLGRKCIDDIYASNKIPIIVGGSGLYIDALINDYNLNSDISANSKYEIEKEYEKYTNEELYNILMNLDSNLAIHTHPNNRKRVLRYIERAKGGKTFENDKPSLIYDVLFLFLNRARDDLYNRINQRTLSMLDNGWIDECKMLRDQGIDLSKIKEIGYSDINDYLDNKITKDVMIDNIQIKTRHYAKRQITWFKNKTKNITIDAKNIKIKEIFDMIYEFLSREQ